MLNADGDDDGDDDDGCLSRKIGNQKTDYYFKQLIRKMLSIYCNTFDGLNISISYSQCNLFMFACPTSV